VWPVKLVSLAGAPKGRFGSETEMEAARECCCDVKPQTDGGRRAAMWCPHNIIIGYAGVCVQCVYHTVSQDELG
jgi:hypothetical protein